MTKGQNVVRVSKPRTHLFHTSGAWRGEWRELFSVFYAMNSLSDRYTHQWVPGVKGLCGAMGGSDAGLG